MNKPLNRDQGVQIICTLVAECLACDVAEVQPGSQLISELGADSLDFVDLIFALENRFGVRIREQDLNLMSRATVPGQDNSTAPEFLQPDAVSRLLPWVPELATVPDLSQIRPAQVLPLITVEALWRLVEQQTKLSSA